MLWLPVLSLAAFLLHEGVQDAVPFVALGAIFLVVHLLLLLAYWLRATLRKQAAKELPTQELLVSCSGGASSTVTRLRPRRAGTQAGTQTGTHAGRPP